MGLCPLEANPVRHSASRNHPPLELRFRLLYAQKRAFIVGGGRHILDEAGRRSRSQGNGQTKAQPGCGKAFIQTEGPSAGHQHPLPHAGTPIY